MYSPLNEDFMFQEMHDRDRVARASQQQAGHARTVPNRRWWRKAAHVAR